MMSRLLINPGDTVLTEEIVTRERSTDSGSWGARLVDELDATKS